MLHENNLTEARNVFQKDRRRNLETEYFSMV